MNIPPTPRLNVAIVAPSIGILGGQAVQADRLVSAWRGDPDVRAWLVPINPVPRGRLARAVQLKYVRTIATQLTYWPLLLRELRQADIVHVFSASYFSFLLAPLPAVLVAKLFGKPVVMNYRNDRVSVARRCVGSIGTLSRPAFSTRCSLGLASHPRSFRTSSIWSALAFALGGRSGLTYFPRGISKGCTTSLARFVRSSTCRIDMPKQP
jgi:hypothetical protein